MIEGYYRLTLVVYCFPAVINLVTQFFRSKPFFSPLHYQVFSKTSIQYTRDTCKLEMVFNPFTTIALMLKLVRK